MKDPVVYLCGGISGLSDAECKDWREEAKRHFPNALDPMRRDYRGREADHVADIVNGDLADIRNSDALLANCVRPSWGTAMEIFYAHSIGKTVVAIVPDGQPVSPWLRHHAWVCATLEQAIAVVKEIGTWWGGQR